MYDLENAQCDAAANAQELTQLRCRVAALLALVIVHAILMGLGLDKWISLGAATCVFFVYFWILWNYFAEKPFERLMNED